MNIVLLGATGLVGNHLLTQLLSSADNHQVLVIGRKKPLLPNISLKSSAEKLVFNQSDLESKVELFQQLSSYQAQGSIDILISCLGTTIKTAGSKENFFHVDHDLIVNAAEVARQCGITRMMLVSAINADSKSSVFYSRVKGQTEDDLALLDFKQLILIKPSLLMGQRSEFRLAEALSASLMKLINPLLQGKAKKYRAIVGVDVARCMIEQLENPKRGVLEVYPTETF